MHQTTKKRVAEVAFNDEHKMLKKNYIVMAKPIKGTGNLTSQ